VKVVDTKVADSEDVELIVIVDVAENSHVKQLLIIVTLNYVYTDFMSKIRVDEFIFEFAIINIQIKSTPLP